MSRPKQPVSDKQVREIVALGKKHVETAFPNPKRIDCPDSATCEPWPIGTSDLAPRNCPFLTLQRVPPVSATIHATVETPGFSEHSK